MWNPTADHLSTKAREILESMGGRGDSQSAGVAEILDTIAGNDEESASDEFLIGCAQEIVYSAQHFIHEMKGRDYWGDEHPDYPKQDWIYEVNNKDTLLGYWQWVEEKEDDSRVAKGMADITGVQETNKEISDTKGA